MCTSCRGAKDCTVQTRQRKEKLCLCFAVSADHAWFYNVESVKRSLSHQTVSNNTPILNQPRVAVDFDSKRSEYRTWKPWCLGCRTAGCFDDDNLAEIRLSFLSENISPRVTYCSGELKALHVSNFSQHIYKRPQYALSMQCWAQALSFHGHDAPYRGEGIASYTHQVVMALVKTNVRKYRAPKGSRSWKNLVTSVRYAGIEATNFRTTWNLTTRSPCATMATVSKSWCRCAPTAIRTKVTWSV